MVLDDGNTRLAVVAGGCDWMFHPMVIDIRKMLPEEARHHLSGDYIHPHP
jgi:hypothetical protein